jgi:uncharacterized membrane protein YfcA
MEIAAWILTGTVAFLSSVLSGVAGFGGAMIFLPFLVATYGVRASVPILTISVLMGNASRVYFFRRSLNWKVISLFSAGAIPMAVLGSFVYVSLPGDWIKRSIGLFLLLVVAFRRIYRPMEMRSAWFFAPLGGVSGFLSAIVGGIGPVSAPFFLAYGLTKEAFVGTEALCAVGMHLAKSITYQRLDVLGSRELMAGVAFGLIMSAGSYAAKNILERISREKFLILVESLLVVVGLLMLLNP